MVQHRGRPAPLRAHRDAPQRPRRRNRAAPALATIVLLAAGGYGVSALAHDAPTPLAPHGLAAVETAAEMVSLEWKPVALADSYEVVVSDGADMQKQRTYRSKTTTVQIPGLHESTKYFVKVRGVDLPPGEEKNPGDYSTVATVETAEAKFPALIPPTGLRTTAVGSATIDFTWDPIIKSKHYELQYSPVREFNRPKTIKAEETTAQIKGLDAETRLFVRLRAQGNDNKTGRFSRTLEVRSIVPTEDVPLRVASYNVKCHSCGGSSWGSRRMPVARTITGQNPDVIGIQEAAQSRPGGFRTSQFEDLRALLSQVGDDYQVTQPSLEASKGTRILYKPSAVVLLDAGSVRYGTQKGGQNSRYFAWAIFRQRSTGQEFFFVSTHMQPGRDSTAAKVRGGQVRQLIGLAPRLNPKKYPTMMVGDFNDYQYLNFTVPSMMHKAGYIDSLGVQYRSRVPAAWATAEERIHTNYDTFNDSRRFTVKTRNPAHNGTYLDYIFTSPMKVKAFENVVNGGGVIPSDHNMIRADVVLPY